MKTQDQNPYLSREKRIDLLLEEYRSLNSLLLFRLTAMDNRLPISYGVVTAAIASMLALPLDSRTAVLVVAPPAFLWLVRTTVQHARSKEDHLHRIAELEKQINCIAGEELLVFQSQHPSQVTAGRTGSVTIWAVTFGAIGMLLLCMFLFLREPNPFPRELYIVYIASVAVGVILGPIRLSRYRYEKNSEFKTFD